MSWDKWHHDPREGEWPERMPSYCPHGIDEHEADCGICLRDELTATDVLGAALVAMLRKIQERDDETMGAHLAARFNQGE